MCRDCPVPNCGARYLVKLSNHLSDVHEQNYNQKRKWLQEAKLQPKVKVVAYDADEQLNALKKESKKIVSRSYRGQNKGKLRKIKESSVVLEVSTQKMLVQKD